MSKIILLALLIFATPASGQPNLLPIANRAAVNSLLKANRKQIIWALRGFNKEASLQAHHHKADEFDYENFNEFVLQLHPALIYYTLQYLAYRYPEAGEPVRKYLSESSIKESLREYLIEDKDSAKEIVKFKSQVKDFKKMSNKKFLKFIDRIIDDLTSVEA